MQRVLILLRGPRFWMLFASLVTRGAGFVTSFIIARLAGGGALGIYSSLVNTASILVTPFWLVVTNNSTIMAVNANNKSEEVVVRFARANALMAVILSLMSFVAFYGLFSIVMSNDELQGVSEWLVLLVAASVIAAQVFGAVVQGFYNGVGHFVVAARVFAAISALAVLAAFPVIYYLGLAGAFGLLIFSSIMPLLLLGPGMLRGRGGVSDCTAKEAFRQVCRRLWVSLPTVGATGVNAAVSWLCTIYFVQKAFGMPGVGMVAVAGQWLTLLLMPATSWSGVTIKMLSESAAKRDKFELRREVYSLVIKNVTVTFALGAIIALASGLIAKAYGLQYSGIVQLLCVNVLCAVVASINNVYERLIFCIDRQPTWFVFSTLSLLVQLGVTIMWINNGVVVVALGMLAGGVSLMIFCVASMNRLLSNMERITR